MDFRYSDVTLLLLLRSVLCVCLSLGVCVSSVAVLVLLFFPETKMCEEKKI